MPSLQVFEFSCRVPSVLPLLHKNVPQCFVHHTNPVAYFNKYQPSSRVAWNQDPICFQSSLRGCRTTIRFQQGLRKDPVQLFGRDLAQHGQNSGFTTSYTHRNFYRHFWYLTEDASGSFLHLEWLRTLSPPGLTTPGTADFAKKKWAKNQFKLLEPSLQQKAGARQW